MAKGFEVWKEGMKMQEFIDKLIGRLEEESFLCHCWGETGECVVPIEKVDEIAKELAEQHYNGWISVNDRLPDKEGSYLVIGRTGGATVTRWYAPSKFHPQGHFGGNSADYIRYWMPRPQPPFNRN